jgi:hypothetical protein
VKLAANLSNSVDDCSKRSNAFSKYNSMSIPSERARRVLLGAASWVNRQRNYLSRLLTSPTWTGYVFSRVLRDYSEFFGTGHSGFGTRKSLFRRTLVFSSSGRIPKFHNSHQNSEYLVSHTQIVAIKVLE